MLFRVGQRFSLKDHLCTVRYVGHIAEKPGEWLGVEWDDPARGKHDGSHGGRRYFECRSSSPTAASFLKPQQPWDTPRTFLQALREKYMPEDSSTGRQTVYFSSKQAEEVGFEKFAKRQAQLHGIHVIVLDHMRIHWDDSQHEGGEIAQICSHVRELDLSSNLFESISDILSIVTSLPKLASLTLDGNRLSEVNIPPTDAMLKIKDLSLSNTLFTREEIALITKSFPNITRLSAVQNGLKLITAEALPKSIRQIVLSDNSFTALSDLTNITCGESLETLILKRCSISEVWVEPRPEGSSCISATVQSIDLRENHIADWAFFNNLGTAYPAMIHLQISGNPIFNHLTSAEGRALTSEDGYMLTIARLPQLQTLNYSKITEKERLNAETYYLSQIAAELSKTPEDKHADVLRRHPRWTALCEEYGEPTLQPQVNADTLDPRSLAARLAKLSFRLAPGNAVPNSSTRSWSEEIPKSFNIYSLFGAAGKKLGIMPLKLRLIWETDELQPADLENTYNGPEWWDSSDEEGAEGEGEGPSTERGTLVQREVELVPSTRPIGTYIEGREARIRVELKA